MKKINIIEFMKYKFICIIISIYLISIFILMITGVISISNFINNLALLVGWIVVLHVALVQLQKNREDNQIAKREEIKKSLEIDAFREVNKANHKLSDTISSISITYFLLPSDLERHFKYPKITIFNKFEVEKKIRSQVENLLEALTNFVLTIESNEIALISYHHYRLFITFRVKDVEHKIDDFQKYFSNIKKEELFIKEGFSKFKEYCNEIYEDLSDIVSWLYDYRIALMNSMLGDIFESKVPIRKPKDPKYKTLTELATKEKVEKELEERESKISKEKTINKT